MLKIMETVVEPEIVPFVEKATDFVLDNAFYVVLAVGIIAVIGLVVALRKRYY